MGPLQKIEQESKQIEFLIWKLNISDAWNIHAAESSSPDLVFPSGVCEPLNEAIFKNASWITVWDYRLNQDAIEAVNRNTEKGAIFQNAFSVWISITYPNGVYYEESFYFRRNPDLVHGGIIYKSENAAKDAALKYYFKEVVKND